MPEDTFVRVRGVLIDDRDRQWGEAQRLQTSTRALNKTRRFMKRWSAALKFAEVGLALAASRRAGRQAMELARHSGAAADFHRWRIAVKTLWYEMRLLEGAGGSISEDISRLKELEDWLGEDHNVVVLCGRLFGEKAPGRSLGDLGAVRRAAEKYQKELREKSLALGARLYEGEDARYVGRVQRDWVSWRSANA
jgi:hypothetical protein